MKMKNILLAGMILAVSGLFGCNEPAKNPANKPGEVVQLSIAIESVKQEVGTDTKTVIGGDMDGGFYTSWEVNNRMGVYTTFDGAVQNANKQFNIKYANDISDEGKAAFTGSIDWMSDEGLHTFYAYYPFSTIASTDHTAAKSTVPMSQTMKGKSYDETADIMIAAPKSVNIGEDELYEPFSVNEFEFNYVTGFVNMFVNPGITKSGVSADEVVTMVEMEVSNSDVILGGAVVMNLVEQTFDFGEPAAGRNKLSVAFDEDTQFTLGDLSVWFVTAPFSLVRGDEIKFTINTTSHTISKTIQVSDMLDHFGGDAWVLDSGRIKTFGMTIDAGAEVTEKVAAGTVLWGETWDNGIANQSPDVYLAAVASSGTMVYGGGNVAYLYESGSIETSLVAAATAGGTAPELAMGKTYGTWTVSGIPVEGVDKARLSMLSTSAVIVESYVDGSATSLQSNELSASGQCTIDLTGVSASTLKLVIKAKQSNLRLDNVQLTVI